MVNDSRHSMMELRCRTLRRRAGTRSKGSDRQLHSESQEGAEDVLTGSSAHNITMTATNSRW